MNDRKRMLIMLPVLAIAAWLAIFGDKSPGGAGNEVAAVAPRRSSTPPPVTAGDIIARPPGANVPATASGPGAVRQDLKQALNEASVPNLFGSNAPPPPPPAAVVDPEDLPPPPPSFTVIGSMNKDGRLNVFLDKDNQTYVAIPGAVIDGNRVDVVKSDQVQLFNLSTQKTQIIPIEGGK
ncbi:hypothetical protein VVD49_14380 [Uliginosibacterium sp. H3]|uniref:Type II secretion system protein GspC N-terminal domain-containing protein n=1 Tax=Uliginosibacterium silvisoli TaxID=3114758 RepID=A0ABU6K537_9RHOO|nr:hypothetical protein [Uliginosibacterium sp. H3]